MQKNKSFAASNLAPLKKDTISFSGLLVKKTDFDGLDFAVVEKYKAPLEKFKTKEDLQKWCEKEIKLSILNKDFGGRQEETKVQRKAMLKEWINYVLKENGGYNSATKLLILDAMTKELKPNNDNLPPVLNKGVLADCIAEIENNIKNNKNYSFNLNKMYQTKLANFYLEDTDTGETDTKWVKIPSKKHDPKNFDANVDKLKVLSHKSWCTKSYNAKPYLEKGDFYVFLEKGQPKIGVRLLGNKIQEIQGELNDGYIPLKYFDEVNKHIEKNNLKLHRDCKEQIKETKERQLKVEKIKQDLAGSIKDNDVEKILNYFGIVTKKDDNGFLTISEYKKPLDDIRFEDLDINENDLFKKIKCIEKNADFIGSNITSLGVLEEVKADLYLNHNGRNDIKAPNLKIVRGSIIGTDRQKENIMKNLEIYQTSDIKSAKEYFTNIAKSNELAIENIFWYLCIDVEKDKDGFLTISEYKQPNQIFSFKDVGIDEEKLFAKVKKIKGDANFVGSSLKSLGNLEYVGGNLVLGSQILDLGNLKEVGGDFSNYCGIGSYKGLCNIKTLGGLKKIGGDMHFYDSRLESLGDLEFVGKSLHLNESKKLKSLDNLKKVCESLYLTDSGVEDLGDLEYVGSDAWFNRTKIKDVSKLKYVGEYIYYRDSQLKYRDFSHIKRNHNPLFYIWDKIYYVARDED